MRRSFTIGGYVLSPVLMALVPLIGFPAITTVFGVEGWLTFAVAQAVGGFALAVVELGWAWNGPIRVARVAARNLRRYVALTLLVRGLVFVPFAVAAGVIAYTSVAIYRMDAGVIAVVTASQGFSFAWLYIGRGRPWQVIVREGLPRIFFTGLGAAGLYVGFPLWTYAVVSLLIPSVLSVYLAIRIFRVSSSDFQGFTLTKLFLVLRSQSAVVGARLTSAAYLLLPTILVNASSVARVAATFASGDRVLRLALSGLAVIPNIFQRWVGAERSSTERIRRAQYAVLANFVIGALSGLALWLAAPTVVSILLSSTVKLNYVESAVLGLIVLLTSTSRATGGLLAVVIGRSSVLLASTIAGAAVGVVSVWYLSQLFGAVGGFAGVALAETAVLATQLLMLASKRTST